MGIKTMGVDHVAIIVGDVEKAKSFYVGILGFTISGETWRADRTSWKVDLALHGVETLELFTFPDAPPRLTEPEALGLRHLALNVADLDASVSELNALGIATEAIRFDEGAGKRFTFLRDPDGLPIELRGD